MIKCCPDLTSYETVKAVLVGNGDFIKPVLNVCIKSKCAAYKNGICMKYHNTVTTGNEERSNSNGPCN